MATRRERKYLAKDMYRTAFAILMNDESGFIDDTLKEAYEVRAFNRVIEPEQVAGIILRTENGNKIVE